MPNPPRRITSPHEGAPPAPRSVTELLEVRVRNVHLLRPLAGARAVGNRRWSSLRTKGKNHKISTHVIRRRVKPRHRHYRLYASGIPAVLAAAGPLAFGWVAEVAGIQTAFPAIAAIALLAIPVFVLLRRV